MRVDNFQLFLLNVNIIMNFIYNNDGNKQCRSDKMDTYFSSYINERKIDDMSLCGMVLTAEGIIAFADSKATIRHWMGHSIEDKDRKPQKLLYNDDVVIVTTGYNQFIKENGEYENLEKGIQLILDEYQRTKEVLIRDIHWIYENIFQILKKTLEDDKCSNYLFLVGTRKKESEGYIYTIYRMNFSHEEKNINILKKSTNSYFYSFIGDDIYCKIMGDILYEKSYSIDELPHKIEEILQNVIQINEITRSYNPVGGEIHTYILK